MRTFFSLFFIVTFFGLVPASATHLIDDSRRDTDPSHKSYFVFKAERNFVGAKVEVFADSGRLLTTQTLEKRKMVIDFDDLKTGHYTIRLSKDNKVKEFVYVKK